MIKYQLVISFKYPLPCTQLAVDAGYDLVYATLHSRTSHLQSGSSYNVEGG